MEKDLIINGSLIIAFLFLVGQMSKDNKISPSSSLKWRLITGGIFGLLGSCLMLFSIEVSSNIIVDMRFVALILSAISGGGLSVFLSAIIMSFTRIQLFGFNEASISAVVILLLLSACSLLFLKLKWPDKLIFWILNLLGFLFLAVTFTFLISDKRLLIYILQSFFLISMVVAYFSYTVYEYIQKSNELYRRYKVEAKIDFLTGLYNYRQFMELFETQKNIVTDEHEHLSILTIDIDYFKRINDTYGHSDGDKVLQKLGMIMMDTTRKFDIVARCGGEEFSIMLLDCPEKRALEIAEKLRKTVETEKFPISNDRIINVTVSIGVSSFPETTKDINGLLKQADDALYEAKRTGRNRVCLRCA